MGRSLVGGQRGPSPLLQIRNGQESAHPCWSANWPARPPQEPRPPALSRRRQDGAENEVLAKGVVAEEVLRVARRLRCTLIVLATHGRTGLKHVLMGSVAENVVRRAPCPVLIVRPRGYKSRG